jgi:SAM-dependent methyltransferase
MGRWSRPAAKAALDRLALPPGVSWLDVGCGTGASTEVILSMAEPRDVLGVDPSEDFLVVAREQVIDERVRFAVGAAEALPAPDESYAVVISGLVLHFVPDPPAAMAEMKRVTRAGGALAAYVWDIGNEEQFTRPFWRAAKAVDPDAATWDTVTKQGVSHRDPLLKLFERAGLDDVTMQEIDFPVVFRDFDDYWQPCLLNGTSPVQRYASALGAEQQAAVRERLQAILPVAGDGSIALRGHLLVARGVKPAD